MKRREKIVLVICSLLVGILFFVGVKIIGVVEPTFGHKVTISTTSNVKFGSSSNAGTSFGDVSAKNRIVSLGHYGAISKPSIANFRVNRNHAFLPAMQSGGMWTLYSTASVSPHSYGGGGGNSTSGSAQYSQKRGSGTSNVNNYSSANNFQTFVAMSSQVRSSAEEFEYGENAIGADNPHAVIRRTPGSGPVTDDPGHTPTVVGTTPIGEGVCFMIVLAIGYAIKCKYTSRKEAKIRILNIH